jgi:hypothetical protein
MKNKKKIIKEANAMIKKLEKLGKLMTGETLRIIPDKDWYERSCDNMTFCVTMIWEENEKENR